MLSKVDHLVYLTPDFGRGVAHISALLGIEPTPGGQHTQWGTRNAVVSLGESVYLEILGPDPEQKRPADGYPLDLETRDAPALVTWAAKGTDLARFTEIARQRGVELGEVISGQRERPDGVTLRWDLTSFDLARAGGIVPFFIDWHDTPHPGTAGAARCSLVAMWAVHPDPDLVRMMIGAVGLELAVKAGPVPALCATLDTPNGRIELR